MNALYHDTPDDSQPSPTKKCNRCKIVKPLDEFYRDKSKRDKHSTLCKACILDPHKPIVQLPLIVFELTCNKCGVTKDVSEFYNTNGTRSGYTKQCKECLCKDAQVNWRKHHEPVPPPPQAAPGMKFCCRCKIEKPHSAFGIDSTSKDGLYAACMECSPERNKTGKRRNWQKSTPHGTKICTKCGIEKSLEEFHRPTKKQCADGYESRCKDCTRLYHQDHRAKQDKEVLKQRSHEYYANNTQRHRETVKAWFKRNPTYGAEKNARSNAFRRQVYAENVDYESILEREGFWCYICESPIDPNASRRSREGLTFDHKIPLQPRPGEPLGTHTEDNIHPAHLCCNTRKSNIPFELLTPWLRRGLD